ncbi:MAG TPA: hypothetical protein VK157_13480, partial [Phycisphaerales bacterium]|nr:hypothetical protein [Phycisphaerales bacterium]
MKQLIACTTLVLAAAAVAQPVVLKDNGPFITAQGTGANGADISLAQPNAAGDGVTYIGLGVTNNTPAGGPGSGGPFRNGDQLTIPAGETWDIDRVEFFAFQTQSSNFSTEFLYSGAYIAVYDQLPGAGVEPIYGDYTTNRLRGGAWTGAYRVSGTAFTNQTRPIMRVDIDMSWLPPLPAGDYYFAVSLLGDPARTGTIQGILVTPNPLDAFGIRYANVAPFNGWFPTPLEWPYRIMGTASTGTACDTIDFNQNGVFPEDQDVVDFFNVLAGGECSTCNDIDFNNNG